MPILDQNTILAATRLARKRVSMEPVAAPNVERRDVPYQVGSYGNPKPDVATKKTMGQRLKKATSK